MLRGVLCGLRCAVRTYWLGYRCQGCGPPTMFSVAIVLAGMRRNKDSAHTFHALYVLISQMPLMVEMTPLIT